MVTVLQCYSVTVLQCYSVTVLQCYSVTVLKCYSVTALQQCYAREASGRSIWKKYLVDVYIVKMIVQHCFVISSAWSHLLTSLILKFSTGSEGSAVVFVSKDYITTAQSLVFALWYSILITGLPSYESFRLNFIELENRIKWNFERKSEK